MAERQVYTNRDGVAEPNALLDYERFILARKAAKEMAGEIISASPDGVVDGVLITGKSLRKNPVRGGIYFAGIVASAIAVPLFLINGLVATFAPAQLSADAPAASKMGNFVGRTVNYVGSTLGRPVVAELATQTYSSDGKLQTTQVNQQQPVNYNYSSGVLLTSDGGQTSVPTQGLTQQQQEAIARLSGN